MPCDGLCYRPVNGLESTFGLSWRYPLNKTIWQKMNKAAVAERFKRYHFVDINIVFSLWNFVCSVAYSFQPPRDFNVHMGPSSFLPLSEKTRSPRHWHYKRTQHSTLFLFAKTHNIRTLNLTTSAGSPRQKPYPYTTPLLTEIRKWFSHIQSKQKRGDGTC